jgi:hypothetical protein
MDERMNIKKLLRNESLNAGFLNERIDSLLKDLALRRGRRMAVIRY